MTALRICVLGSSACAWEIADRLDQAHVKVLLAARDGADDPRPPAGHPGEPSRVETLSGVRLSACSGQLGRFDLVFEGRETVVRRTVSAVVLAESDERCPNLNIYGLKPAEGVLPLSGLLEAGCRPPAGMAPWQQVVFLHGLRTESHPAMAEDIMRAALQMQKERRAQCCILTRNLKVAGEGLEALSREARSAGVLFFKFTNSEPTLLQAEDGSVRLRFIDDPTGKEFRLAPDLVVVDEAVRPAGEVARLARILGIESDPAGYAQADNVHRLPAATNRRGIIVAGPARFVGTDAAVEASNAVLEALFGLAAATADESTAARIDSGRCIRCLTCLRVCPYRAVALDGRPQVLPAACERCGICAAECPREAIRIAGFEHADLHRLIAAGRPAGPAGDRPHLVAFCCRRSAAPALRAAADAGSCWPATLNIIEVPCAGGIAPEVILAAFRQGADGVLVLACHADNCHSHHGNHLAQRRAEVSSAFLDRCGAGAGRLLFKTLASNMAAEAAAILTAFAATLHGPKSRARSARNPEKELP
jgi:coenzyme F420-reducing hydrogenase delta subunit/Pyruvate/2-oxoacid:ferredoxin oxidoreductase delta subunit